MGKIRMIYATKTGHSKKIAEAMGKALYVKAEHVSTRPVLEDVDLLFIVGGIYGGESLPLLLNFVKALDRGKVKRAVLVTSCATKKHRQDSVRKLLQQKGIEVLDEIICPGSFLFIRFGHPNKRDIEEAVNFALRIAGKERERVE